MQNVFLDTRELDLRAQEEFGIPNAILMENAARGMLEFLLPKLKQNSTILLVCGSGDNGADVLALARMLYGSANLNIYLPFTPKSSLCQLQFGILKELVKVINAPIKFIESLDEICPVDVVIDGIFGAGFKNALDAKTSTIITRLNALNALKIACDIPSGLGALCNENLCDSAVVFKADFTLSMGALKLTCFLDSAKDYVGEVHCLNLGIPRSIFETYSPLKLLERSDFKLPLRKKQNTHKGNFGHLCVYLGDKQGAGILCALSALRSGTGLVSVLGNATNLPYALMQSEKIPHNTSAIAIGMGLGKDFTSLESLFSFLQQRVTPMLLDADIFCHKDLLELLKFKNIILTPHPKEFLTLLARTHIATPTLQALQAKRFYYALAFCEKFPNATLVLKGANTLIAQGQNLYINPFGNNALAKGGSGDVLSGCISGLLAQGYTPLDAAINGTLMQNFCAESFCKDSNNFSLNPLDLIEQIRYISPKTKDFDATR